VAIISIRGRSRADSLADLGDRKVSTVAEDAITLLFGTIVVIGVCLDGWAHHFAIDGIESFFTPWHGVLYTGYALASTWTLWLAYRRRHLAQVWWRDGWPVGYRLGALGMVIFGLGGLGDMIWHEIFGIEIGLLPSFSPTHILAIVGGLLLGTSPLRAWWATRDSGRGQPVGGWRAVIGIVSMTFSVVGVCVVLNWGSAFMTVAPTVPYEPELGEYGGIISTPSQFLVTQGVASYVVTTLVLVIPLLMMHRRRATLGAGTILVAGVGLRFMVINEFPDPHTLAVLTAVGGAVLADLILVRLDARRGPEAALRLPIAGAVFAVLVWSGQFLGLHLAEGVRWPAEIWAGVLVLTGGLAVLLGGLASRPAPAIADW
jgi:hypothetical protein